MTTCSKISMLALFLFVACAQKEPANDNSNKTLSAPRDLKVEQVGDYTLKLDWTDASEGESCFKVYLILPSDIDHPVLKAKVEADCTSVKGLCLLAEQRCNPIPGCYDHSYSVLLP